MQDVSILRNAKKGMIIFIHLIYTLFCNVQKPNVSAMLYVSLNVW